jgi:ABC-type uncharacterized transport system ATPase subunit
MASIVARGLSKRFDDSVVLRDLSLDVQAGEIFGLIGPSGSGKRVPGVRGTEERGDTPLRVTVEDAQRAIPALLDALETRGAAVRAVAQYQPTFDEVFIRLIAQHGDPLPPAGRLVTSG